MLIAILVLTLLLLLNGVFAMCELAMMTSRESRLAQAAESGSKGAATALALAREPTRFLSTIQVGITLIGILAGAFGESTLSDGLESVISKAPLLAPYADTIALVIVVVLITYFSLVIGELVPKQIALAHPEAIASVVARPLDALSSVAAWPVKLLGLSTEAVLRVLQIERREGDDVSEDDVRSLVARAASTGIFTPQEHRLFQRTMRVGDLTVRDLMVPRNDIIWIDESQSIDTVCATVRTHPRSYFPICRGGLDRIVGVAHIKDLIAAGLLAGKDFNLTAAAHKPLFVPETMPALKLLDLFHGAKTHLAFVADEFGSTQGLLTVNDVTSALVGDISRRGQRARPAMILRKDGSWLIDGRMSLHDVVVTLALPPDSEEQLPDVSTAGGIVSALLGHIPREGEVVDWQGWRIEVVDMDGARVDKLLAVRAPTDSPPGHSDDPAMS
jgi:putative hemolysin